MSNETELRNVGIGTVGVQVEDYGDALGRVLIAARDFDVGDIVLEESPLVVFQNTWLGLLQQYCTSMSKEDQQKLMDMQHLQKKTDAHFKEFLEPLVERFEGFLAHPMIQQLLQAYQVSEDFAFQLSTLVSINSHMYTTKGMKSGEESFQSALFYLASKAAHACQPNACYSSKLQVGKLVYYAIQPIVEGEMITISYLSPTPMNALQRRKQLKESKDFFCQCRHCQGVDYLSAVRCIDFPMCKGVTMPTYWTGSDSQESCSWCCEECSNITTPELVNVAQFEKRLVSILQDVEKQQGCTAKHCNSLDTLINDLQLANQSNLAPFHWLILQSMYHLFEYYSELASIAELHNQNMAKSLHKDAFRMGLQLVQRWQCAESMCDVGRSCTLSHKIVIDALPMVLSTCLQGVKIKQSLPSWVDKYLPYLQWCYGFEDDDVLQIIQFRKSAKLS